ncbi:kalirin isoform X7 [Scyliorhinus canicula]|uniref:kalirin isoform X7 n=1 Tax=Scyliorhinus canicula TaxID=7830 RepID=UPI0018F45505|nr:kalirin isoform X7 [Scyliorhinus canicula]
MRAGSECCPCRCCLKRILANYYCCCWSCRDAYSPNDNGAKSESVSNLQPQPSLNSMQNSPGPKRSGNTLKKWLTSPVRRLSSGKADNRKIVKQKRGRNGKTSVDPASPKAGENENAPQEDSADEKGRKDEPPSGTLSKSSSGMQSGGEDEPDDESHTPLPPPMKIIDNDPSPDDCSSLHTARQSASEIPSAADLVNAIEKLVKSKLTLEPGCSFRSNLKDPLSPETMNSSLLPGALDEEKRAKALKGRTYVLDELIQTERDYVKDLGVVVEGFMKKVEEKGVPDDMKGKEKIVFGNIHQIYDWHSSYFQGELEKCLQEPERLAELFIKHERRLGMYVVYCQNKPKSEYIVAEYDAFFEEIKQELGSRLSLSDFLIKPIQRITKYQLLIKDFLKFSEKAGQECSEIEKAANVMYLVPKRCNDMMNLGRLEDFEGKITAQGKLLQQDTFYVTEQDSGVLSRSKERRVFLFEQIVIFSELLNKGSSTPRYQYKNSIKMSYLNIEENVENELCKFALISRGTFERFILQAPSIEVWQAWVQDINLVLDAQRNFLNALQSPIEYMKRESGSHSLLRTQASRIPQPKIRTLSSSQVGSEKPPKSSAHNPSLPALKLSTSNGTTSFDDEQQYGDNYEQIKNNTAGCNGTSTMLVTQDYRAVKENEICVFQGEMVQVLAINQQNMFLVYRPANEHSPAAEGWIPGFILSYTNDYSTGTDEESIKKSCSWHTSLHLRKRGEKESSGKNEGRFDNDARKSMDILTNKASVDESNSSEESECDDLDPKTSMELLNPNFIHEVSPEFLIPLSDLTCSIGETVILRCKVCGRPKPAVSWKGPDQNVLVTDTRYTLSFSDSGEVMLKICNIMPQDSGIYSCLAVNEIGSTSSSATIKVQGVPAAPGRPIAQERSNSSVILRWLPPASTGNCTISSYTVEYREEGTLAWQQSVASTLDTYLVIEDLLPGCQYQFRVSASNPWGISSPSEPSDFVTLSCSNEPTSDNSRIPWKDNFESAYTELFEIGRGRFSVVKKCIQKSTKREVAVKFISKKMKKKDQVAHEAAILLNLQHPQFPAICDTYEYPTCYILVLELLDNGRLLEFLVNQGDHLEEKVAFYIRDTLEALQYLHNCRVAHLDLKPENLLIDLHTPVPRVKLIDLGDAIQITTYYYVHQLLGNPEFAAPEVIQGTPVSLSTDIWSLGVLTYVMLSGVSPFLDESVEETCMNICRRDFSFPDEYFQGISHVARDFIRALLQGDFRWRPTAATCLQNPWLHPQNDSYSTNPLDTSRLALFIERRRHQNDVRPVSNVKVFYPSSLGSRM